MINMPEATTLKKTDFAYQHYQYGQNSDVGGTSRSPSACWNFVWLKLNSLYCWEFIFAPALVLHYSAVVNNARKYCFLGVIYPLWLLKSFLLLFHKDPWASGRGGVIQTTAFRLRIFQFFCSLHLDRLWISILIEMDYKQKGLEIHWSIGVMRSH